MGTLEIFFLLMQKKLSIFLKIRNGQRGWRIVSRRESLGDETGRQRKERISGFFHRRRQLKSSNQVNDRIQSLVERLFWHGVESEVDRSKGE